MNLSICLVPRHEKDRHPVLCGCRPSVVPNSSPATNMLLHVYRMHNDNNNGARRVAEGTKVHKSCFGSVQFPRRIRPERDPIP